MQTLGAIILYGNGIPLYRRILADPAGHAAELRTLVWALPSIALMQAGYWIQFRLRAPLPGYTSPVLGHLVLFVGRFAFLFATGLFTFVFLAPRPGFSIPVGREIITVLGLFSIFCFARELDQLGRALLTHPRDP
jgi:hypothetical protein